MLALVIPGAQRRDAGVDLIFQGRFRPKAVVRRETEYRRNRLIFFVHHQHAERSPKQIADIRSHQFLPLHMPSPDRGRRRRKGSWVPAVDEPSRRISPESSVALISYCSFFKNGVA